MVAMLVAGCGSGTDYKNNARPPAPLNITASVSNAGIAVSPTSFGAGPIVLIVTNQTGASQEVTFESNELGASKPGVTQTTEPINPRGTGQLQVNVTRAGIACARRTPRSPRPRSRLVRSGRAPRTSSCSRKRRPQLPGRPRVY